jgi:hypothetical protein
VVGWSAPVDATMVERIPVGRLNAYLWQLRSDATCGNGGPHSDYRHLADKDAFSLHSGRGHLPNKASLTRRAPSFCVMFERGGTLDRR